MFENGMTFGFDIGPGADAPSVIRAIGLFHRLLRAFADTHLTLDTQRVVYHRIAVGILCDGTDRARLDERAHMIVRTYILIYLYHSLIISYCKPEARIYTANLLQINHSTK